MSPLVFSTQTVAWWRKWFLFTNSRQRYMMSQPPPAPPHITWQQSGSKISGGEGGVEVKVGDCRAAPPKHHTDDRIFSVWNRTTNHCFENRSYSVKPDSLYLISTSEDVSDLPASTEAASRSSSSTNTNILRPLHDPPCPALDQGFINTRSVVYSCLTRAHTHTQDTFRSLLLLQTLLLRWFVFWATPTQ